jgi:hypothetical protein
MILIICSKYMASSIWVCVSMQVVTVVTRKNPPIRYTGGHMTMSLTLLTWLPAWLLDIVKTRLYVFKRPVRNNNNHGDWVTKSSEESHAHKILESAVLSVLQPGEEYEWRHLLSSNVFLLLTLFSFTSSLPKSLIRKCLLTIFQLEIVGHLCAHERCMFGAFNPFIDAY